tara:strand:- start:4199 stop:4981 length:783 start_codon:yes stop_codon:yes gene_type:complete
VNDISHPIFSNFNIDKSLQWQMSRAEKYCLIEILSKIKPDVSLEIGTYMGGSLQVLSKFSKNVYTIDISKEPERYLKKKFNNVEFIIGKSYKSIASTINKILKNGRKLEFILIDGDHSKEAVRLDLIEILKFDFKNPLTIIMHDSFNPNCRRGIKSVDFKKFGNVSYVELDYITGSFSPNLNYKEMWGGFCLIQLNSTKKNNGKVLLSQNTTYNWMYLCSIHLFKDLFFFLKPFKRIIYKFLNLKRDQDIYYDFSKNDNN